MKLSLITICYNSENTILKTLDSVHSQVYTNIEYIIIDGLSKDNTNKIIRSHEVNVDVHISEQDDGIFDAYNKGIMHATGDVIGFINSDDFFYNTKSIHKVMQQFKNDKSLDVVYGNILLLKNENKESIFRKWKSGSFKKYKLFLGWMPPHPGFFIKKDKIDSLGFDKSYSIAGDYDFMIRHLLKIDEHNIKNINEFITCQLIGGVSTTLSLNAILSKFKEDIRSMKANRIFYPLAIMGKNLGKINQFFDKKDERAS